MLSRIKFIFNDADGFRQSKATVAFKHKMHQLIIAIVFWPFLSFEWFAKLSSIRKFSLHL